MPRLSCAPGGYSEHVDHQYHRAPYGPLQSIAEAFLPPIAQLLGLVSPILGAMSPVLQVIGDVLGVIADVLGSVVGWLADGVGKVASFFGGLFGGASESEAAVNA